MAQYQSENYFAIDPVLKPETSFRDICPGRMNYSADAQQLWDGAHDTVYAKE
ncbi:hypothetical protein ACNKHS_11610 [Shigella flexneri]